MELGLLVMRIQTEKVCQWEGQPAEDTCRYINKGQNRSRLFGGREWNSYFLTGCYVDSDKETCDKHESNSHKYYT